MPSILLVLSFFITAVFSASVPLHSRRDQPSFAPAHGTDFIIHDPAIILAGGTYYAYSVGDHILIHFSSTLSGPWNQLGSVLPKDSIIGKGDGHAPWSPSTIYANGKYYCYYCVSESGSRDSAVGVATSSTPWGGDWTDHVAIIQSGKGNDTDILPFDQANALDPSVSHDESGQAYLTFGSYWTGIWQVPLNDDLLSVDYTNITSEARHLVSESSAPSPSVHDPLPVSNDPNGPNPVEGPYMSYTEPWYYLWFSHGDCCTYDPDNLPPAGQEYSIRVGRSKNPRGPFVDRKGTHLADGGGEIIYGSNRDVYAPGGQQVLKDGDTDILYYHFLNTTIGYSFNDARLGWNPLKYVDGWPVAVY